MVPWLRSMAFDVLPISASVFLAYAIVAGVTWFFSKENERPKLFLLIFGLATLGAVSGVAGGSSRVGVVGDIIPAALGLAGGVSAYLFGVDRSKGLIASICAAAFALALGFGYAAGAGNRSQSDIKQASIDFCRTVFSDSKNWADDRAFCRTTTSLGEECAWLFADAFANIPEYDVKRKDKFQHVYATILGGMRERTKTLKDCNPTANGAQAIRSTPAT